MRLLGIIFLNLIGAIIIVFLDHFVGSDVFLKSFLTTQMLSISATILGFNLSGIIFLLGQIAGIENGEKSFQKSKKEIKDNIVFMGITFLILIFFLVFENCVKDLGKDWLILAYRTLLMTIFFLQIFASYEIVNAVFHLKPDLRK